MLEVALKLLEEITSRGFKAYIVGGFVRDYILGINSNDIDITTSATPKDIKEIFDDSCLPSEDYGSVTVIMKGIRFEITTFRKEIGYIDNRRPAEIKYIDDLYEDLLRRDFTINTICMDQNGEIVDLLNGREDLEMGIIRTVGVSKERFEEDVLRILRAVRFATILDFKLDNEVIEAIKDTREL
ncbi:MAG: CCA tRNA nucleotidyltransferase, partial [Bacilli bacterium]|nr:CCA tRNA nucleotidyltransferase [Bacilli bacterium]